MKTWFTAFTAVSCKINEDCVSIDKGQLCEDDCVDIFAKCAVDCGTDSSCIVQCNRDLASCSSDCPCHSNCENGCPCDYESLYCNDCKLDEFNQDQYTKCSNQAAQNLSSCNQKCDAFDDVCLDKCAEQFHNDISDCPCMDNCTDGCPCGDYECDQIDPPTTDPPTITNSDVNLLVLDGNFNLNKFSMQFRPPMVFDDLNRVYNFDLDNDFVSFAAKSTCSVLFNGQMQITAGGMTNDYKMSTWRVRGNKMEYLSTNASYGMYPLCSIIDKNQMVLCGTYNQSNNTRCQIGSMTDESVDFHTETESKAYSNQFGSMHQQDKKVFVFGGFKVGSESQTGDFNSFGHILEGETWIEAVDGTSILPEGLAGHSSIYFGQQTFIFGGYMLEQKSSNIVLKVNGNQLDFFSQSMRSVRSMHRSLVQGNSIIHIGDRIELDDRRNSSSAEIWQWNGDDFNIFKSHSSLTVAPNSYIEAVPINTEDYEDEITKDDIDVALFVQSPASSDWNHNDSPRIGLTCMLTVTDNQLDESYFVEQVVPNTFEEIDYMCAYRIQNRFFLAGSKNFEISAQRWELTTTGWEQRPHLPFGFDEGRCIDYKEDKALLCSAYMKGRKCAIVDHTDKWGYIPTSDTIHDHYGGEMVNYNETKMIISGTQERWVETIDDNLSWTPINQVPAKFKRFSAVNFNTFIYVFGGEITVTKACVFNHIEWKTLDQKLIKSRQRHASIASGTSIIHVGGYGDPAPFEVWNYNEETDQFDIYLSEYKLDDWHSYPYVFDVTSLKSSRL